MFLNVTLEVYVVIPCTNSNSETLFKDGDPVSLQLIFSGAIQTCEQYNAYHTYIHTNTGSSDKHRQTQLTLSYKNIPMNTHT